MKVLLSAMLSALLCMPCLLPAAHSAETAAAAVAPAETQRLHALFDAQWERLMRTHPEWATYNGDHRYGDRLQDASREAIAAEFAATRSALAQAQAIRRDALSAKDAASRDIFIHLAEERLRLEPFVGFRSMSLGALGGFQSDLAELLRVVPVAQRGQVEQLLARLAAFPKRVDQELALLREGQALRWVPPRTVLERVLLQIDGQLTADVDQSPFFEPFTRLGKDIPAAEQEVLREQGRPTASR